MLHSVDTAPTVTVAGCAFVVPPAPVHDRLKLYVPVVDKLTCVLPVAGFDPLQPATAGVAEAKQDAAPDVAHDSVLLPPPPGKLVGVAVNAAIKTGAETPPLGHQPSPAAPAEASGVRCTSPDCGSIVIEPLAAIRIEVLPTSSTTPLPDSDVPPDAGHQPSPAVPDVATGTTCTSPAASLAGCPASMAMRCVTAPTCRTRSAAAAVEQDNIATTRVSTSLLAR